MVTQYSFESNKHLVKYKENIPGFKGIFTIDVENTKKMRI